MIVINMGYLKIESVLELEHFSIYETNKKTHILVKDTSEDQLFLYFPKEDRLPYKILEGKKICRCKKVFDSKLHSLNNINVSRWNNGNQNNVV